MTTTPVKREPASHCTEVAVAVAKVFGLELPRGPCLEPCIAQYLCPAEEAALIRALHEEGAGCERWKLRARQLDRRGVKNPARLAVAGDLAPRDVGGNGLVAPTREWSRVPTRIWVRCAPRVHADARLAVCAPPVNPRCTPLARYAAQVRWLVHGLWLEPCAWRAWRPEPALWPRCLGGIAKREPDREPDPGSLAEPHLAAGEVLVGPHRLRLTGVTSNEQAVATIERQWRGPDSQAAPCTKALWPAGPLG